MFVPLFTENKSGDSLQDLPRKKATVTGQAEVLLLCPFQLQFDTFRGITTAHLICPHLWPTKAVAAPLLTPNLYSRSATCTRTDWGINVNPASSCIALFAKTFPGADPRWDELPAHRLLLKAPCKAHPGSKTVPYLNCSSERCLLPEEGSCFVSAQICSKHLQHCLKKVTWQSMEMDREYLQSEPASVLGEATRKPSSLGWESA